ncbi:unnamed protein product [Fusarium venenatum]|uniref:Uncharacterized protein n=1 Tax=Fusarium venenatum TaxID=56646 RepID=A0A2L2TW52_9HYPO|nr:uncharacterized protein FVRRES_01217 [Fusarium venenatum]CEI64705.1 unnamed protein product [Fusarium venenatum]
MNIARMHTGRQTWLSDEALADEDEDEHGMALLGLERDRDMEKEKKSGMKKWLDLGPVQEHSAANVIAYPPALNGCPEAPKPDPVDAETRPAH